MMMRASRHARRIDPDGRGRIATLGRVIDEQHEQIERLRGDVQRFAVTSELAPVEIEREAVEADRSVVRAEFPVFTRVPPDLRTRPPTSCQCTRCGMWCRFYMRAPGSTNAAE